MRMVLTSLILTLFFLVLVAPGNAQAACTGVSFKGVAYDTATSTSKYCDGTNWVSVSSLAGKTATPLFVTCTNEQSDGDGTGDVAACVSAAANGGKSNGTSHIFYSCEYTANPFLAATAARFVSNVWQFYTGSWYGCDDGTIRVINLNAYGLQ